MSTIKKPLNNKRTRANSIKEIYRLAEEEYPVLGRSFESSVLDEAGGPEETAQQLSEVQARRLLEMHYIEYDDEAGNINPDLIDHIHEQGGNHRDALTLLDFLGY